MPPSKSVRPPKGKTEKRQKGSPPAPLIPLKVTGYVLSAVSVLISAVAAAAVLPSVVRSDSLCAVPWAQPASALPLAPVGTPEYNEGMLWGSYRPQVLVGMRSREEEGFLVGVGWGSHPRSMRYEAEDDAALSFGWRYHDASRFGVQEVNDTKRHVVFESSFAKETPKTWSLRMKGDNTDPSRPLRLVPVLSLLGDAVLQPLSQHFGPSVSFRGATQAAGEFVVTLTEATGACEWIYEGHTVPEDRWKPAWGRRGVPGGGGNQVVAWCKVPPGYHFDILVSVSPPGGRVPTICSHVRLVWGGESQFAARFAEAFGARAAASPAVTTGVSNLLGGMGYWHGAGLLVGGGSLPPTQLFSGVPSRSKFPRGFLWDEGFHQLIVGRWEPEVSKEVLLSWLKEMDTDGWIPREQIKGPEPRSRVPPEFVPQDPQVANPPTLLLQVQTFALQPGARHLPFLREAWPLLQRWHRWFQRTQSGPLDHTYRWRGRDGYHLLPCGLDDYPRSRCISDNEMHVDLLSWMFLMVDTMQSIAVAVGDTAAGTDLTAEGNRLRKALFEHHWDQKNRRFADVAGCPPKEDGSLPAKHVPHVGYVTLFPLLCGVLDVREARDREALEATLELAESELLTEHGLRSLSEASLRRVKKHDNYWTGPIWMNINYMFVRALKQYGYADASPRAAKLLAEVQKRLISMVEKEHRRTGKMWENYNATTGEGRGTAPFTGWTTLVALMDRQG